jgi:hypothetical protein
MNARRLSLVVSYVLMSARITEAGIDGGMFDAEWFETSDKILVLEYENPLGGAEGVQLSQLIGRMALSTTTGVGNLAVITLRQMEKRIPLTDANVKALAERQRAPIVIWGEFYEQTGRVFVTSHLRYAPTMPQRNFGRNTGLNAAKFSWNISQLKIPQRTEAYASLPSVQINFSPVEISSADLGSLQEIWKRTVTVRAKPDEASAVRGELALDTPYSVRESVNGWTSVSQRNIWGWVLLDDLNRPSGFSELVGAVLYAQGLMQHLTDNPRAAQQTFNRYLKKYASNQDPVNKAVAHVFAGYSGMKGSSDLESAPKEFEIAKALLPNASSPINCLALALFAKAERTVPSESETLALEKDLIRAVQTENDVDAIRNLEILYQLPQTEPYFKKKSPNFMQARDTQLHVLRDLEQRAQGGPNG